MEQQDLVRTINTVLSFLASKGSTHPELVERAWQTLEDRVRGSQVAEAALTVFRASPGNPALRQLLGEQLGAALGHDQGAAHEFSGLAGAILARAQEGGATRAGLTFGSGNQFGDLTFGDIAGGHIIKTGDISGSGIAIGPGAQSIGHTIGTGGSDSAAKAELRQLIAQLAAELQKVPVEKARDAEAVAETARQAVEQATKEQPNKALVTISADGLKQAAQNLAAVLPSVLPLATKLAEAIQRLAP